MKTTYWLSLALSCSLTAGTVLADKYVAPGEPASTPSKPKTKLSAVAVAKPAPAGKLHASEGPLMAGPAVVRVENANVRAQADINSEVVVQLKERDEVVVVETITLKKRDAGEPAEWAKIEWPSGKPVWVYAALMDSASSEVKAPKVNLRAGPGENHSVVATLQKGAKLKKLDSKGDWWKVEAPDSCHAFVAADLLESKEAPPAPAPAPAVAVAAPSAPRPVASGLVPPPIPPAPRPRPTFTLPSTTAPAPPPIQNVDVTVSEVPPPSPVVVGGTPVARPVMTPPAPPVLPPPPTATTTVSAPPVLPPPPSAPVRPAPSVAATPAKPVVAGAPAIKPLTRNSDELTFRPAREETYVRRVISREGVVRSTWNVQAPSWYWLENVHNGRMMNYLYSTSTNINLGSFKGRTVTVKGEEALDERWPNIPVIRVESLQTDP